MEVNKMSNDKPVTDADITYLQEGIFFFDPRNQVGTVDLPEDIFQDVKNSFMIRANGNGMHDAGIDDGDYLLFQKTDQLGSGEIGAFVYGTDHRTTCRIYKKLNEKTYLLATSTEREPVRVDDDAEFQILGRLLYIIKDVRANRF